ncbi:hypothetical protein J3L16_12385 [Alteromonas sp. 5E99-2]|uniref:hypothetical protein n=1 Tax=Alteromonas sp. 5E99-2 TaxID=2817683 RepID=UPI001A983C6B|nr:hypothetical protein [Alteromonas sp. 5E99-2]MBO1256481.1 hypothetical protein [Alteromonas sp. 5E99-2]
MKKLIVILLSLLSINLSIAAQTIPVLEYYPSCDYQVIKKIKTKARLRYDSQYAETGDLEKAFQKAKKQILKASQSTNGDAIVLTKRTIKASVKGTANRDISHSGKMMLYTLEGEILKQCEDIPGQVRVPSPITPDGQISLTKKSTVIPIRSESELTFDNLSFNEKGNNFSPITNILSFENGAYGIKIEDSQSSVVKKLGIPAVELWLQNDISLMNYGNTVWLVFLNKKLIKITNNVPFLNQELSNLVPFSNKLEENKWIFTTPNGNTLSQKMKLPDSLIDANNKDEVEFNIEFNTVDDAYEFHVTQYLTLHADEREAQITSFSYYQKDAALQLNKLNAPSFDSRVNLDTLIKEHQKDDELLISHIPYSPIGIIRLKNKSKLYIFNNNLIVKTYADRVNKIELYGSIFPSSIGFSSSSEYKLLGLGIGDDVKNIIQNQDKNIQQFGDIIEIETPTYTYNLYVDNDVIYKAEVLFY